MIDELYQDIATEGDHKGEPNGAHLWWVRFTSGATRPATETEVELWQLAMGFKDNYSGACRNYWDAYCAGTGKNIDTFDGVNGETPEKEIENYRKELERQILRLNQELNSKASAQGSA